MQKLRAALTPRRRSKSPATAVTQSPAASPLPNGPKTTAAKAPGTPTVATTPTTGSPSPGKTTRRAGSRSTSGSMKRPRNRKRGKRWWDDWDGVPEAIPVEKRDGKPVWKQWENCGKSLAGTFMSHYAELGPDGIKAEFKKELEGYKHPNFAHTAADANPAKNRNNDVVTCLDESRVKLKEDKYINASKTEIVNENKKDKMFRVERKYIVTQMPFEWTLDDFWQMMYDEDARYLIIFVPDPEKQKAEQKDEYKAPEVFWPTKEKEKKVYGKITLQCEKSLVTVDDHLWKDVPPIRWSLVGMFLGGQTKGIRLRIGQFAQCEPQLSFAIARHMLQLGRALDVTDNYFDEEEVNEGVAVVTDEFAGLGRASLFVAVDALGEALYHGSALPKDKLLAPEVCKWVRRCRNGAIANEEEYLLVIRAAAELVWRANESRWPRDHVNQYTEQYKQICGCDPPPPPEEKKKKPGAAPVPPAPEPTTPVSPATTPVSPAPEPKAPAPTTPVSPAPEPKAPVPTTPVTQK